ncbi:cytochrome P450 [Tomitella fengzijianii]|uniref:Cytochrome P450 n=1 Tax=Tomitella fengzijianii TaxID=2597660 RepID=A0A516X5Y0_9ACTN|nr:cytochrome P450 [Tomitella fengzijianii]QDQ98423.1 cytochrome P450 [Tomitella fengzijianii]
MEAPNGTRTAGGVAGDTGADIRPGTDITEASLYSDGIPHALFARLRAESPVWWNPQPRGVGGFGDEGFWVVSTNELVRQVSRDGATFSSWENTATTRYADDCPREHIEAGRSIMLNMDAPEHTGLRAIVSRGFTPRAIATLRAGLAARARGIVESALASGAGNFVEQVATELPLQAIADIIGVPQDERRRIFDWSTTMTGRDDPDIPGDPAEAIGQVFAYAMGLAAERRAHPADDIVTTLVRAQDESGALTDAEFGSFLVLLMVAGSETTRDAVAQGLLAFQDHPDQWDLYRRERPATAVDEIVRWASPVMSFQRTATRDADLGGKRIRRGDRVVMLYASANYDEAAFTDPRTFDITRSPNPHVGFGGTGPHFCLGHNLARMEVELIFDALADLIPDITVTGPAVRAPSGWLNALKDVPARYPACPVAH